MSYMLIDCNNNDIDFNNIIIGKKIKSDENNSKHYIYYKNDIDQPKEMYLRIPSTRLIYSLANHKYNQIKIPIYPNWEKTNNFVKYIKQFENNIIEYFKNKNIEFEFSSLLSKTNMIQFIKVNLPEKLKITSSIDTNMKLEDLKINGMIEMIVKISYVWIRNDDNIIKIGLSSQLYQIKYNEQPEQLDLDFIDNKKKEIKPEVIKKDIVKTEEPIRIPVQMQLPSQPRLIPSISDLQNAMKKLKPLQE